MSDFDFRASGEAAIEGDWIAMKVAIPALTTIVEQSPDLCGIKVTNAPAFAVDLVRAINEAAEDGTTPFHRMFDCVIAAAIDDGSEHVEDTGEATCAHVIAATCGTCGGSGCAPGSGYYWPDNPPPPCPDCDGPAAAIQGTAPAKETP